jgi:hypothetical protein
MIKLEITIANPLRKRAPGPRRRSIFTLGAIALAIPMLAIASPVTIPNEFADGEVISATAFNENFGAIADSINDNDTRISELEEAPPNQVTIRKATATSPVSVAIAFCEDNEILTGGGCFLPPENLYDPDYANYETYFTGNFPRPMVGLTSVPVAAGTTAADIRPVAAVDGIIPFPGDIIAEDAGSIVVAPAGGWACRPGVVQHNDTGGAQAITTNLYEEWFFPVKAYAVCMAVE